MTVILLPKERLLRLGGKAVHRTVEELSGRKGVFSLTEKKDVVINGWHVHEMGKLMALALESFFENEEQLVESVWKLVDMLAASASNQKPSAADLLETFCSGAGKGKFTADEVTALVEATSRKRPHLIIGEDTVENPFTARPDIVCEVIADMPRLFAAVFPEETAIRLGWLWEVECFRRDVWEENESPLSAAHLLHLENIAEALEATDGQPGHWFHERWADRDGAEIVLRRGLELHSTTWSITAAAVARLNWVACGSTRVIIRLLREIDPQRDENITLKSIRGGNVPTAPTSASFAEWFDASRDDDVEVLQR